MNSLLKLLKKSNNILILTGAGISAESGIPVYRSKDSTKEQIWNTFSESVSTINTFEKNPEKVWELFNYFKDIVGRSKPNEGHHSLDSIVDILRSMNKNVTVCTQNIDSFHKGIELHGNLQIKCNSCGTKNDTNCCSNYIPRPNTVFFGEPINPEIHNFVANVFSDCDLLIFIGTSGTVQPWNLLPKIAKVTGIPFIYINLEKTSLSEYSTIEINGESSKILLDIFKRLNGYN